MKQTPSSVSPVEIKRDCTALVTAFAHLVDQRRYDELTALFTADGVFARPGSVARGQSQILAYFEGRPANLQTRHVCAPTFFEAANETEAQAITYVTIFHAEGPEAGPLKVPGAAGLVEFHDRFERSGGAWRIAHHESRIVMLVEH